MSSILVAAITVSHAGTRPAWAPARRRRSSGRQASSKVDYQSRAHAGAPHRGRITDAEKHLVAKNLARVNRRLRQAGLREIDPGDPVMRERYGL